MYKYSVTGERIWLVGFYIQKYHQERCGQTLADAEWKIEMSQKKCTILGKC